MSFLSGELLNLSKKFTTINNGRVLCCHGPLLRPLEACCVQWPHRWTFTGRMDEIHWAQCSVLPRSAAQVLEACCVQWPHHWTFTRRMDEIHWMQIIGAASNTKSHAIYQNNNARTSLASTYMSQKNQKQCCTAVAQALKVLLMKDVQNPSKDLIKLFLVIITTSC